MGLLELVCSTDHGRLLDGWNGAPADRLAEVVAMLGLQTRFRDLDTRQGALDVEAGWITVNRNLSVLEGASTNVWGLRNQIIAHQLGHFRLHRTKILRGDRLTRKDVADAGVYGTSFLMPEPMLRVAAPAFNVRVQDLARDFRVTTLAMASRLKSLSILPSRTVVFTSTINKKEPQAEARDPGLETYGFSSRHGATCRRSI